MKNYFAKFKRIPAKKRFSYPKKCERTNWAHKYCPKWAWSENIRVSEIIVMG